MGEISVMEITKKQEEEMQKGIKELLQTLKDAIKDAETKNIKGIGFCLFVVTDKNGGGEMVAKTVTNTIQTMNFSISLLGFQEQLMNSLEETKKRYKESRG